MAAPAIHEFPAKDPGEVLDYAIDFVNLLASGENLTGTPTVAITPTGAVDDLAVVAGTINIVGTAVVFFLEDGVPGRTYTVTVGVDTDAAPTARRFERSCLLPVKDR